MSEVVEYRVKRNRVGLLAVVALMLNLAGILSWLITAAVHPGFVLVPAGMGFLFNAMSMYALAQIKAATVDGRCRAFMVWKGAEYSDPPLNDWEESLEERDAFEVNV